ncbi:MAG: 5-(carboxyamino)imidazole ribonucleotide synthase [Alphaproteobacteria bacterium 64-11]|nr:5-(carboxyamino)imidazole ribonucleotide synthase [Alphaproteobacteria bacterium]OJU12843.1 MAG: 5-(carboxyamino)imidazole ribonucleotide synthase [Alphaproteobacteria bacterium 64-11]
MTNLEKPVPPGGTIGIVGGGQLGRMLAMAAARLGLQTCIFNDAPDAPAFQVTPHHVVAPYEDLAALEAFADRCDAVTFESENLPAHAIARLAQHVWVAPGAEALAITQDRLTEKSFVEKLGLKTAPFREVSSAEQARAAFDDLGGPAILKTRRFGYDGKGQAKVTSAEECVAAFGNFKGAPMQGSMPCILEGFVDFAFEASVVAARARDGAFAAYDPPENLHEHHILRRSTVPGRLTEAQGHQAKAIAHKIAAALDYVGVLAVELFVGHDGGLTVNEIAPRVHNSGHWTIEACQCSQFEQHIRAVAGWPLGSPVRHADAVMENIIGAEADAWESLARSGALHLYGKKAARPGRKMGHVTRLLPRGSK